MNDTQTEAVTPIRPPHPTKDAKRAKFERLAVNRTKRVIKGLRILANMGGKNRYAYEFSQADVDKIVTSLTEELQTLREKMIAPGRQLDIEFDL